MSHVRDKAQALTKQIVGQMVGDDLLVQEGQEQERKAAGDDLAAKQHRDAPAPSPHRKA